MIYFFVIDDVAKNNRKIFSDRVVVVIASVASIL